MSEKKRSIFEEVGGPRTAPARPAGGLIERGRGGSRLGVRAWLVVLFLLVVAMIVVGGLTRLTDSGLAITEWRPVTGALPPMDADAWEAEFARYQASAGILSAEQPDDARSLQVDLLVGMGPSAAWPAHRAGLGGGVRGLPRRAKDPVGLDRASSDPRRARCRAGRDRLVDGVLGPRRGRGPTCSPIASRCIWGWPSPFSA